MVRIGKISKVFTRVQSDFKRLGSVTIWPISRSTFAIGDDDDDDEDYSMSG